MKALRLVAGIVMLLALIGGAWVILFHSEWVKPVHKEEAEAEVETEVPVHVAKIGKATLHRYSECLGAVVPELRRSGKEAAAARIASSSAGIVSEVLCVEGQLIEKGAPLFQLDERAARAEELKAEAALASAQSSLAKIKASTRPEQIEVAKIALNKAKQAVAFAEKADLRQKALAADQLAATKQLEESALALASAREDQTSAEKQLKLLENSPSPEEIAEAAAKVAEAEKAIAATQLQRTLLSIKSPLAAKVMKVNVNPGELVDTTTVLAELVDTHRLEALGAVPSTELKELKAGQPVEIRFVYLHAVANAASADSGESILKCTLASIGLQIDPKTDTVAVRAALPAGSDVMPGQAVRMRIMVQERIDCLAVPEECVFRDKVGIPVIALVENDKSSLQNVTPGLRENGLIEIEGKEIKEGGIVVSAGAYGLPEETKIRILQDETSRRKK